MVFKIVWTPVALRTYASTIECLKLNWTDKEVIDFAKRVERKLEIITHHPFIGRRKDEGKKLIRRLLIHKRVLLIYKVRPVKKQIELLIFGIRRKIHKNFGLNNPGNPRLNNSNRPGII